MDKQISRPRSKKACSRNFERRITTGLGFEIEYQVPSYLAVRNASYNAMAFEELLLEDTKRIE